MSLLVPTREPSSEVLDDEGLSSAEMVKSLEDLAMVNRLFGSSRSLARGIVAGARRERLSRLRILDVGAGGGDVSRRLAQRLRRAGLDPRVLAIDLQWRHLASGRSRAGGRPQRALTADAFRLPFADGAADWVVSTLLFHHFSPEENVGFLRELARVARRGIAVLDLRRHRIPLLVVSVAGRLLFRTRVSLHDGMASVRQAYTVEEARSIAARSLATARVRPVFPYRILISANPSRPAKLESAADPSGNLVG